MLFRSFSVFSKQFADKRIVHISPGNLASSNDSGAKARNYAMQFVPPDCNWICYIDDDDVWHQDRLWKFNMFIDGYHIHNGFGEPLKLFYSYGDLWKFKHRSPRSSRKEPKRVGLVDNVTCGGMCHTLDIFQKTKGWNPANTEDHDRELFEEMAKHTEAYILKDSTFDFYWR